MSETVELRSRNLQNLAKALKVKPPKLSIGIFDAKEAVIGAAHEFGTSTLPMRSFLRIPLMEGMKKKLEASNIFQKDDVNEVIRLGTLDPWTEKVAEQAKAVIDNAFDTGGDGKWPPAKHATGHPLLIDTGRLRGSIEVKVT